MDPGLRALFVPGICPKSEFVQVWISFSHEMQEKWNSRIYSNRIQVQETQWRLSSVFATKAVMRKIRIHSAVIQAVAPDWSKLQTFLGIDRCKAKFKCAIRNGWWTDRTTSQVKAARRTHTFHLSQLGFARRRLRYLVSYTADYPLDEEMCSHQQTGRKHGSPHWMFQHFWQMQSA